MKLALGFLALFVCSGSAASETNVPNEASPVATFYVHVPVGPRTNTHQAHVGLRLERVDAGRFSPRHVPLQSASLLDFGIGRRRAGEPIALAWQKENGGSPAIRATSRSSWAVA